MSQAVIPWVWELTLKEHQFSGHHLCRGNNSKRKSRIGLIEAGHGHFMYLNQRIPVSAGDIVFIPEKLFCYSEWFGEPDIRVTYLSFHFSHDEDEGSYMIQALPVEDGEPRQWIRRISQLLQGTPEEGLEAYSLFYHFLARYLPLMNSRRQILDKTLYGAIDYINQNWNRDFAIGDVAAECAVSESKLYHLFQEQLGQTPINYLNAIKVNYAIQHLENKALSIAEICRITNFHSESYFRRVFRSITGSTPSEYRKACKG